METSIQPGSIDQATLTPVVRRVLGSDSVQVLDCRSELLHGGFDSALSGGGIYRFSGTGQDRDETVPWSVVLKLTSPSWAGLFEPGPQVSFQRERLCYESGLLADLPSGIAAPGFFGSFDQPDGMVGLWLEDIVETVDSVWPLGQYGITARHLGQLNGAYLAGRPLPDQPWLARDWLRGWMQMVGVGFDLYPSLRDHPDVRRGLPGDLAERGYRLWREREPLLAALDRLPQTFCHGDTVRGNLLARGDQTIAIDWTDTGIGAVGGDLAPLVNSAARRGDVDAGRARDLDDAAFANYVAGLREVGWRGDPWLARFGYVAAHGLRYGLGAGYVLLMARWNQSQRSRFESTNGSMEAFLERGVSGKGFALDLADEAWALLPLVG